MRQVVDDYLNRVPLLLNRATSRLESRLPGRLGRLTAHAGRASARLLWPASISRPKDRNTIRWGLRLDALVDRLASLLVDLGCWDVSHFEQGLDVAASELRSALPGLPAPLRRQLLHLPACFRSFDQAPEDLESLAVRFAERWKGPQRPLAVVGVRSSGSYLAPLVAAFLRRLGYRDVLAVALRPGQRLLHHQARALRDRCSGLALVIDDPPVTWHSVLQTAQHLQRVGFEPDRIIMLMQTFESAADPPAP